MDDYEAARRAKLQELQAQMARQQEQHQQRVVAERQLNEGLKRVLTPKAKERLSNIRLVKPEVYTKVSQFLMYLAQSGKVQEKISEAQVKEVLQKVSEKRNIRITRK